MSNYGTLRRRNSIIPIAIGLTASLSMMPASWLGWTSDLADLVRVPITPVSHVGMMLTNWVRPATALSDLPGDEKVRNDLAIAERDQYRQLYLAQMLRSTALADQLRLLQELPESALLNPVPPVILPLDITGLRPSDVVGIVELKLIRGVKGRIHVGDIAVVGSDIVGRISKVGLTRIELMPMAHKDTGLIRAAVVPAHPPKGNEAAFRANILLRSRGDGYFYAEVPTSSNVHTGDLVVLDDPSWSQSGAGLILGDIQDVSPLDDAPLRASLVISPRRRARDVLEIVVLGTAEVAR